MWQQKVAPIFQRGLKRHGIDAILTSSKTRVSDVAIILGPNHWKEIEKDKGSYIMANRKFIGFGSHVHDNLAISWDGFNGRGTFCIDEIDKSRLSKYINIDEMRDIRTGGDVSLYCEQSDHGRCTEFKNIDEWYNHIKNTVKNELRFRKKVRQEEKHINHDMKRWNNDFEKDLVNVKEAHVLNSTISVELLYFGVPTICYDIGDPSYACKSINDRLGLFHTLANCQWHYDEISNGDWWERMNKKRGPKLHEIEIRNPT